MGLTIARSVPIYPLSCIVTIRELTSPTMIGVDLTMSHVRRSLAAASVLNTAVFVIEGMPRE